MFKRYLEAQMNRRERRTAAGGPSGTSPDRSGTETPATLYAAGLGHLRAERYLDAQICCEQALAIDPDHAESLHLMGLLSLHATQYDHAVEWLSRAIARDPRAEYLYSLGTALRHLKRYQDAVNVFDKAVQLKPDKAELWTALGKALVDLDRRAEALLSFQHALTLKPDLWDAAHESGTLLNQMGRREEALAHFMLCAELKPNHAADDATTFNNIGNTLQSLGRSAEALQWLDRALQRRPDFVQALSNKAIALGQLRRFDEAFAAYAGVKALDPNHAVSDWNAALLHMLTGDFAAGWAGRETRWQIPSLSAGYPKFTEPMWLGQENIEGKTVLIAADEGLGDAIQFARYLPDVAALGARVILVVQDALHQLLSGMSGVAQCIPKSVAANGVPPFDFHCPLGSLPLAFGTQLDSIPAAVRYLPPPSENRVKAWEDRLGPHDKLRVGLVWSGNPEHKGDHHRSTSLRAYSAFLDVGATFVSLQKDPRPDDKATLLERADIVDLTAHLTDFAETAALISCLDLVITVDTSVAHLAGALGCPTWILLPHTPDYRWLLDRDDNPWYPSVRLFRQPPSLDYAPVIDRVRTELLALVAAYVPKLDPRDWEAARQSGIVLYQSGRLQEALAAFEQCDRLRPNDCWTIYMRAGLLYELGRPEEALVQCDLSAKQDPNYAPTVILRALCLHNLERFEESLAENLRAHALDPGNADVCNRIGDALQLRARYEEALSWFDRALALRENFVEALLNKAFSLRHLRRLSECFASYDRVKAIDPDNVIADWNLANLHLLTGNFETGWAQREVRWKMPMFTGHYPKFSQPMWRGDEPIEGKTILVQFDQGFGDTIQFARYLPMLAARGARVLLVVEDALHPLLSGMPGVSACFPRSAANNLPPFDMHCPMMRLPLAFGTRLDTIPAEIPYLPSPAPDRVRVWQDRLEDRLGAHDRLRVGLVWSGSLGHKNDHNRSSSLRAFSAMLDVDAAFVSLQKDPRPDDKLVLGERREVVDLTAHLTDFMETAALISCLDLVITVDTSVAHLAGALGCPTWILLPYLPDWRWLLDRDDSPWYRTVRLFRQQSSRDYAPVIDRMRAELVAMSSRFRPNA
jgi:tetratricopeptide (TPR) repeat protein